jgi:UDP-3-O-[3-hydroxymyristoyl] glucosamine N-acyltransferase
MPLTLAELGPRIGAAVRGDGALCVSGVAELAVAGPAQLAFYSNAKYKKDLRVTRAGAVIVAQADEALVPPGAARLVADQPYVAFAKASALFHGELRAPAGVHERAFVAAGAEVEPSAAVLASAYVGPGARIGARTTLHAGVRVLDGAVVGEDCTLWPGAVVRERCVLGNRVVLQPNAVVGSDGFGFAFDPEGDGAGPIHRKVPQAGIVRIEDDVEVGACSCIDRATLGETVIGRGTKIDNLVQIGHNVKVGLLSLIVAQVGISGSTELGMGVVLAGQVGVAGHVKIGDGTRVGGQSGVFNDLPPGVTVSGTPTRPQRDYLRSMAALHQLPDLMKEIRKLSQRVEELEKERT